MIFWTGSGLLAILFLIIGVALGTVVSPFLHQVGIHPEEKHGFAVGIVIAGLLCWFVGRRLYQRGERVFVDKATGHEFAVKPSHTFMFIPLHYCGVLLAAFAVYMWINGMPESRKERRNRRAEKEQEAAEAYERELEKFAKPPNPEAVATAQQAATKKYPELGKADTQFNRDFVALYTKYKAEGATVMSKDDWPMLVADEVAAKMKRQ